MMKKSILLVLLAAGLGVGAFGGYSLWLAPAPAAMSGELEWLREEFDLDAEQYERVAELHAQYRPVCDTLCDRVIQARESLNRKLVASPTYTAEIEEELGRFSRVKEECHRAMVQHFYDVAAVMGPEERERYLEKAKMQVTMHDAVFP